MAVVPDPQKLFLPDPEAKQSVLHDKFTTIATGAIGLITVLSHRYFNRRPILSGIQAHIIATLGGAAIGKFGFDVYESYQAEKDAMYRHYISLHPEHFPMPERIKVGDMFTSWTPIR